MATIALANEFHRRKALIGPRGSRHLAVGDVVLIRRNCCEGALTPPEQIIITRIAVDEPTEDCPAGHCWFLNSRGKLEMRELSDIVVVELIR